MQYEEKTRVDKIVQVREERACSIAERWNTSVDTSSVVR